MKHFFYIDPIENLNIEKDSSLFMALTLKNRGEEVYLLFDHDFYITNFHERISLKVYEFSGKIGDDFYVKKFKTLNSDIVLVEEGDFIHFRIDPPVSEHYLKVSWLLSFLEEKHKVNVINSPEGILLNNEKLLACKDQNSLQTCVGASKRAFEEFAEDLKDLHYQACIFKPLNSFSGKGIYKVQLDKSFPVEIEYILKEAQGAVIMQPFVEEVVTEGELRSVFWMGEEIGTIRKYPPEGSFLSNVAQGGSFEQAELNVFLKKKCQSICWELKEQGILLVAFDILKECISEVNITCPGLLVEVSHALKENIVERIHQNLKG